LKWKLRCSFELFVARAQLVTVGKLVEMVSDILQREHPASILASFENAVAKIETQMDLPSFCLKHDAEGRSIGALNIVLS
jgi:hypothetical protein